jgi:xanthine dehydrogenase accessory factor
MGLSCGGTIEVLVEPAVRADVLAAARSSSGSVVVSVLKGAVTPSMESRIADASADALGRLTSRVEVIESPDGPVELFLEVFPPRPTLLIFGGVHIAMALARMGKALGYRTIVADGRDAFLTRERFPDADELILGWPEEVFRRTGLDAATCVCLLTHDPKFDEPALQLALRSPAGYIGAIGSRKTQGLRREQLRAAGFGEDDIARLHGPIGLDLGGRSPEEIALAILAEITAVRYGRSEARRG